MTMIVLVLPLMWALLPALEDLELVFSSVHPPVLCILWFHAVPSTIFLANTTADGISKVEDGEASVSTGSDFVFSARFSELDGADSMSTEPAMALADELFCNGQIRPLKLSTHLQKPQFLGPLIDFEEEEEESKAGSNFAVADNQQLRMNHGQ